MEKTLLLFQVSKEKKETLKKCASALKCKIKEVPVSGYDQPLGMLCQNGQAKMKKSGSLPLLFPAEMLVLCGFSSEDLDHFLDAYKSYGTAPVALKAVLTPHNCFWTPRQLFAELYKEHKLLNDSSRKQ